MAKIEIRSCQHVSELLTKLTEFAKTLDMTPGDFYIACKMYADAFEKADPRRMHIVDEVPNAG